MRKKILFLTRWYPNRVDKLDGNFIENHARAVSRYCDLAVLYVGSDPSMSDKLYDTSVTTEFGFTVVRVWYRNNDVSTKGIGRIIKFFRYVKATSIGWKLTRKSFGIPAVNHVHIFTRPAMLAFFLRLRFGIPFLITEHSSHFVHDLPVWLPPMKWFAEFSARQARFITAVSKTLQLAMIDFGLKGNYVIIPNVVFIPVRDEDSIPNSGEVKIIAIGGLTDQRKNISGLIESFAAIHSSIPNARLHIVRPVPDETLYRKSTESALLNVKIFFHDYLSNEDVYNLLSGSSFLVVNSLSETFSMSAAEALACGKPVISTRCGGPEEFINEERGLLIPIQSNKELSAALVWMYHHFAYYDPEKLKAFVRENFSEEVVGKKLDEIYNEVMVQRSHKDKSRLSSTSS